MTGQVNFNTYTYVEKVGLSSIETVQNNFDIMEDIFFNYIPDFETEAARDRLLSFYRTSITRMISTFYADPNMGVQGVPLFSPNLEAFKNNTRVYFQTNTAPYEIRDSVHYYGYNDQHGLSSGIRNLYQKALNYSTDSGWDLIDPPLSQFMGNSYNLYDPNNTVNSLAFNDSLQWFQDEIWSKVTSASLIAARNQPNGIIGYLNNLLASSSISSTMATITPIDDPAYANIPSYQGIFESMFPLASPSVFSAVLNEFVNNVRGEGTYFSPSLQLDNWKYFLGEKLLSGDISPVVQQDTSLVSMNAHRVIIINQIFNLIKELIGSIQKLAIAQGERLDLLTKWQKSYTDTIAQIKTFVKGDNTGFGASTTSTANSAGVGGGADSYRSEANTLADTFRRQMETYRGLVADQAKALQSNISQTNDAATQQATLATTLIQQLSALLSAIFR